MAKKLVLALIHHENADFGIHFPDYPGCISGGATIDEAVIRGAETLAFHVAGVAEEGDAIPTPSSPDAAFRAATEEIGEGAIPVLIEVDFPGRAVRVNITIEEGLLSRIDHAAKAGGQTRSAFLAQAAQDSIRR